MRKLSQRLMEINAQRHASKMRRVKIQNELIRFGAVKSLFMKDACESCGGSHKLVVHHKDGNGYNRVVGQKNNSPENLMTLCESCHGKEHSKAWSKVDKPEWQKKVREYDGFSATYVSKQLGMDRNRVQKIRRLTGYAYKHAGNQYGKYEREVSNGGEGQEAGRKQEAE